ncbi:cytochrome C oxidase subunit IV family protein [Tenacibaculum caenipelagi]|uniref:Cytochrome c oxidase subunit IV n=1 Tax=Tenacibaculum caenipelagi TaxID=1325435 RepID=A0A4R6TCJ2_9FLAO|nr:hypothetical protein DFQ07_1820 [Tenacibaculum caenipelagi]
MNVSTIVTGVILFVLTIMSALFFLGMQSMYTVHIILALAVLKFGGVAFQFMELKKAHAFWKILILSFLFIFTVLVISML